MFSHKGRDSQHSWANFPLLAIWAILVFPSLKVQVVGSIPIWGLSLWILLFLPVSAWILSLFSNLSPLPRDTHSGLIVGVCVDGWMDELATCSGCTGYSLRGGWDKHQPYCNPQCWRGINRKLRRNRFKFCNTQPASFISGICCIVFNWKVNSSQKNLILSEK